MMTDTAWPIAGCESYSVQIFMVGKVHEAEEICMDYCDEVGFCVTVTPTVYCYTSGREDGFIIGIINYARFSLLPETLWNRALALAERLQKDLDQKSYTVMDSNDSVWHSNDRNAKAEPGERADRF